MFQKDTTLETVTQSSSGKLLHELTAPWQLAHCKVHKTYKQHDCPALQSIFYQICINNKGESQHMINKIINSQREYDTNTTLDTLSKLSTDLQVWLRGLNGKHASLGIKKTILHSNSRRSSNIASLFSHRTSFHKGVCPYLVLLILKVILWSFCWTPAIVTKRSNYKIILKRSVTLIHVEKNNKLIDSVSK